MSRRSIHARLVGSAVVLLLAATSACSGQTSAGSAASSDRQPAAATADPVSAARVVSNIRRGADDVDLDRHLRLRARSGTLETVTVAGPEGAKVKGRLSADKTRWVSRTSLRPASRYRVSTTAVDADGLEKRYRAGFTTRALTLDEQTFPSFMPVDGQTVGVGMPVIIRFDLPVTDRAAIERRLDVVSKPAQVGSFHWMSDQEVHWRPRTYWRPGTDVFVKAEIGGVAAGGGIYGQKDRTMTFHVGDAMVSKVNTKTDQMRVFRNGKLARTIPITTGEQPKFTTRSGTKVIVEKFRKKRMNSETIGIDPESADGYDLDDVEYAMRLTYSGEFMHAAPWSVASQGRANVSHGCTGMSTASAGWLYANSKVGDVVEYVGTDKPMSLTNGFGDWNVSYATYKAGSALD